MTTLISEIEYTSIVLIRYSMLRFDLNDPLYDEISNNLFTCIIII